MVSGFIRLRRGILEHLESGRITMDEYGAYTVMILKADHRTGIWTGSGKALSALTKWCLRKAQIVMMELARKGYLKIEHVHGQHGNYAVKIKRYFSARGCGDSAHGDAVKVPLSAPGCVRPPPSAHGDATSQEELLQEALHKKGARGRVNEKSDPGTGYPEATLDRTLEAIRRNQAERDRVLRDAGRAPVSTGRSNGARSVRDGPGSGEEAVAVPTNTRGASPDRGKPARGAAVGAAK